MPVKILHLITELSSGGAQSALLRLLKYGDRSRYMPTVVCLYNGQGTIAHQIRNLGIQVYDLGLGANEPRLHQALFFPIVAWRLHRILRREKPTLLHSWLFHANLLGRVIGRLSGVPRIITSRRSVLMSSVWRNRLLSITAGLDDVVIAVCEAARQEEIRSGGKSPAQVFTIYNGIDNDIFAYIENIDSTTEPKPGLPVRLSLGIPPGAAVVGSVGRLHWDKGSDILVQTFIQLRQLSHQAHLLIVGDGPLRVQMQSTLKTADLETAVTFVGERAPEEIPAFLHAMDVFLMPSRSEGLPNAALEAMAAALPVVATAVGGVPEIIISEETGILVHDPSRLAAAVARLLNDPILARRMGQAGKTRVIQSFSVDGNLKQTQQLYENLLGEKPLPG